MHAELFDDALDVVSYRRQLYREAFGDRLVVEAFAEEA